MYTIPSSADVAQESLLTKAFDRILTDFGRIDGVYVSLLYCFPFFLFYYQSTVLRLRQDSLRWNLRRKAICRAYMGRCGSIADGKCTCRSTSVLLSHEPPNNRPPRVLDSFSLYS